MAAELPSFYVLLLLAVVPLIYLAVARWRSGSGQRLPPSPWALPVIGHLHHLAGTLPHRAMRDLARRHGPLMLLRFGEVPVVVASSPDAAREIMKTHDATFATRPIGPMLRRVFQGAEGLVFAPYGKAWRQLRKICTVELLSSRRVHLFRPIREDELGLLLRSVAAEATSARPVNLSERIAAFVADSTVRAVIGCRSTDRDTFLRLLDEAFKIISGMSLPDIFPSSRLAMRLSRVPGEIERRRSAMFGFMDTIIQERQENRAAATEEHEDLLDVLPRLQKEMDFQYPLTPLNIKAVIIDLFAAGSETSATMLQWAMAELMRNPTVMRKAQEEVRRELTGHDKVTENNLTNLHYMRLVIKETLRLHPAAPLLVPRECSSPCEVLGFDVPQGAMVLVNAWAIGRDPAHWDAPEEFVPERFEVQGGGTSREFKGTDFEYLPFGAGRRMCPGMAFGLVHIELALAALLFHFDWELPEGMVPEEMDMTEAAGFTTRRQSDLTEHPLPELARQCGFSISAEELASLVRGKDSKSLRHHKGVDGLARKVNVSLADGVRSDDVSLRNEVYGTNQYAEKPPRTFWMFLWDACQDMTLMLLAFCAVISVVIGVATEGWPGGVYDGVGIMLTIFLVVDQVPADGLFVDGYSFVVDESSLSGESEPVHVSATNRFLLGGTKVQDGSARMLVTAVGMRTEWGNLMETLSQGGEDETPLQVKLNGVATIIGKIGLVFAVLTFTVLMARFLIAKAETDGGLLEWGMEDALSVLNFFAVAVTIIVVAVPERRRPPTCIPND